MIILLYLMLGFSALTGMHGEFTGSASAATNGGVPSVEIGLAELSPNGLAGGIAVPASGASYSCALSMNPRTTSTEVNSAVSWSAVVTSGDFSGQPKSDIGGLFIYRCNTGTNCTNNPWGDSGFSNRGDWELIFYQTATVSHTGETCTGGTTWEPRTCTPTYSYNYVPSSGTVSSKSIGLGDNTYRYRAYFTDDVDGTHNHSPVTCEADLTIAGGSPTASCSVSPTTALVDQNVTWTAQGSGGNGTYTYEWGGNNSGQTSRTVTKSYGSAGTYSASVRVTSNGQTSAWQPCSTSVTVTNSNTVPTAELEARNLTTSSSWQSSELVIEEGDQIALQWDSDNANRCVATSAGYSTGNATAGVDNTVSNVPTAGNSYTYRVRCYDDTDGEYDDDTVVVRAESNAIGGVPTLVANPKFVYPRDNTVLTWNLNNNPPGDCTLTGPNIASGFSLGSNTGNTTVRVDATSTYTLTCPGGTANATVQVLPNIEET